MEHAIELSPDFSNHNIIADLLNDEDPDVQIAEANEINDIQELDNLNFDELLANIEEESSVSKQEDDFEDLPASDDEIILEDFDNYISPDELSKTDTKKENLQTDEDTFLSVDSLLSDTENDRGFVEPYKSKNIDVGLNEFPEFTDDVNPIDVDIDEYGIAAKLDLAKVYIEIGDEDNAQVILNEVIRIGDAHQQSEARKLLNEL